MALGKAPTVSSANINFLRVKTKGPWASQDYDEI